MTDDAIYIIEADPMLSAVRRHIAERQRVHAENVRLAEQFGAHRISTDRMDGTLRALTFKKEKHPDFTKPRARDGLSWPRKGTEAASAFKAQKGHDDPSRTISEAFNIPLTLSYKTDTSEGSCCIGRMLTECGFLYFSSEGPYALWIPDVAAIIAERVAGGQIVEQSFDMVLPGCRRILTEEWELMVAQHKLNAAKAQTLKAEAEA